MAKPYSNDLRGRIAAAVRDGSSVREAAELFGVSPATAARYGQRLGQCGNAASRAMGGAKRDVLAGHKGWLRQRSQGEPDLTLNPWLLNWPIAG